MPTQQPRCFSAQHLLALSPLRPWPTVQRLALLVLIALFASTAAAQSQTTSLTDGKTPTGLTPGAPAGSYSLSGFENVNLFNGNLNFHLPLLRVGGRGSAGYTITLPLEQKWIVKKGQVSEFNPTALTPIANLWQGIKPGYSPGVMQGRRTGYGDYPQTSYCGSDNPSVHQLTLTRLTFTAADGTEYEFRDQLTNGTPLQVQGIPCGQVGASRGTVFVTADGSAATFISDSQIYDYKQLYLAPEVRVFHDISGYLMLKDGTRYRIDNGYVSWIRDRNGNMVTTFGGATQGTITDSLNRQISVTVNNSGGYDEIGYTGFAGYAGGVRKIRVWYDSLGNRLRSDFGSSTSTYFQLFPLNSASGSQYNPGRVSKVELPDGRFYQFYYNPYGELARVELPSGGAFEYDWAGGAYISDELIFRYVTERRVYVSGTLESKTKYIRAEGSGVVEVKTFNADESLLLGRSLHYFYGDAYQSLVGDPALPSAISFSPWREGREYKTETFDIVNNTSVLKQTVEHNWQQPLAGTTWPVTQAETSAFAKPNNPQETQTQTTLADTNQLAKQTSSFDRYGNPTDTYEYDYGSTIPLRHTHTDYLTSNPVNNYDYACDPASTCGNNANIANVIHIRSLPTRVSVYDANNFERARNSYEYDNYTTADNYHSSLKDWPATTGVPISGLDAAFTSSYLYRGNPTATTRHLLVNNQVTGSITSYAQYDLAGNMVKSIDPRSTPNNIIATSISYDDCFGPPGGDAETNIIPAELVNRRTYAFPTKVTNARGDVFYAKFDYQLGSPTVSRDPNGTLASGYYNDALDRPTQIRRAVGIPAEENQTTFNYDDTNRTITTTSDLNQNNDNVLKSQTLYDGLGRTIESRTYENNINYIAVRKTPFVLQTDPDTNALVAATRVSNPFRPYLNEQPLWTTQFSDALGRATLVRTPDGALVRTSYSGNTVTVTDQAGKKRRSVADGLGRLVRVDEPDGNNNLDVNGVPAQSTSYSYDTLDNLIAVNQGTQTRGFVYNSLKRLTSANNPESGLIAYQYDANGNLTQKTDARGVVSAYGYDELNRNTSVSYTNDPAGTPAVTRSYDGATNGVGRLWKTETAGAGGNRTTVVSYDASGKPLSQTQQFYNGGAWSLSYAVRRSYDLAGHVLTQTYPSGHAVSYNYDAAGRLADKNGQPAFSGNLGEGVTRTYASELQYTELGAIQAEKFGTDTPLYHKQRFNQRGQLWDLRLSTVSYAVDPANGDRGAIVNYYSNSFTAGGSGADNNGNLLRQEINVPGSGFFQQNYFYDALNRLTSVAERLNGTGNDTFKQAFTFDRWGNRLIDLTNTTANVPHPAYTVDPAGNNRLLAPAGYTHEYDAAGNQTRDTYTTNSPTAGYRTYDAENRIVAAQKPGSNKTPWAYYTYNGDGQRVRRKIAGFEIWQVYGFDGELLAEYPQTGPSMAVAQPQKEYGYRNGQLLVTAEPYANAAWNRPATQTDNLNASTTAGKATDGDVDGDLGVGHASATNAHANSWWQTDLGSVQTINSITVWGRTDCCAEQSSNFYVFVSDNPFTSNDLTATINQAGVSNYYHSGFSGPSTSGGPTSININRTGRYVRVQLAGTGSLALGEVQVWNQAAKVEWLVTDQLGTPRLVVDKTGSLASVSRHDYLPFGEEIFAGTGGRTTIQGYDVSDGVRQKFTAKERDTETGLDYFLARYYLAISGRFTSADPIQLTDERLSDPQQLNLFVYARNNPLKFTDPTGEEIIYGNGGTPEQQAAVKQAVERLRKESKTADAAFAIFDKDPGKGPNLTINVVDDKEFDKTNQKNTLATTSPDGGDAVDKSVPTNAVVEIRSSAVQVKNEKQDRKDKKETRTEGILSHEVPGHAKDITTNPDAYTETYKTDRALPYEDRENEKSADRASKVVGAERVNSGFVPKGGLKEGLRFKPKP